MGGYGFRIGLSLAFAGQGMVFGLGYNNALSVGEAPAPHSMLYWALHGGLIVSALAVVFLLGRPLLWHSIEALRNRRMSVEALFVLSGAGAFVGSLISSIRGSGSVYYEVVSIVLCVYAIGKQIGVVQKGRVGQAVAGFRQAFDQVIVEGPEGESIRRQANEVGPTDRVKVQPGGAIAVDGVILEGTGYVRETALTGEPGPVRKTIGDVVIAGTWSLDGHFVVRPKTDQPRAIDQLLQMLESAPRGLSNLQTAADRLMRWFVPAVSLTALATFLGWLLLSDQAWWDALFNAMAVLLVACPCALGLAMPAGIWAGLYHLSQRGITGRSGHMLDVLAECRTIVFDKTGTLSEFEMGVDTSGISLPEREKKETLKAIAAIARESTHPVSQALQSLGTGTFATGVETYPGEGIGGHVDGHHYLVGEKSLMQRVGVHPTDDEEVNSGKRLYILRDRHFVGCLFLRERLRPEAEDSLEALKVMGCACCILSGDPLPQHEEIGGVRVEAGLSPAEKAQRVRELEQQRGPVLFVGDGVNDVSGMDASSAALAVDLGASLAVEYADGVLVEGRIGVLPSAIRQARQLKRRLQGNLRFALFYNFIGMGLAAAGMLHPVVAALLMVASSFMVSFRALRSASL